MITLTNGVQIPENAVQLQTTAAIDGYYVTQPLRLVQYDETLPVAAVQLTYQNQPYTPPTGAELNVRMGKPDGTTVYNPCLGMDPSGIVYFAVTQQMTIVAGTGTLTVEITDSGVKNSAPIIAEIRPNPVPEGAIESTDEFLTLQEILQQAEKWGQIVEANAANIQQVVDNLEDIQNAAENAQAAAASAAAAQQAAQEALGFRKFYSAVVPDVNGNLDPSRPMTVGPAASVEIESAGDRIQSVTALGFTQQAGSGDPSPTNVRAITNGGLRTTKVVLGNGINFVLNNTNTFSANLSVANSETGMQVCNEYQWSKAGGSAPKRFNIAQSVLYIVDPNYSDASSFNAYLSARYAAGDPVIVWYEPADESQATGLYAPIILEGGEYRATCLPLTAPLCEGDSVVSWVRSGCDKVLVLDGSGETEWLRANQSGWTIYARAYITLPYNLYKVLCDKYPSANAPADIDKYQGVAINPGQPYLYVSVPLADTGLTMSSSAEETKQAFNQYLSENPIVVRLRSTNYTPAADIPVSLETHVRWRSDLSSKLTVYYNTDKSVQAVLQNAPTSKDTGATALCSIAEYKENLTGDGFYLLKRPMSVFFGGALTQSAGWSNASDAKAFFDANEVSVVYQLATPITYAREAVVLEAATGDQLTYTVTGQSGSTVSVTLKPFQDGGHAKTAENATNAITAQTAANSQQLDGLTLLAIKESMTPVGYIFSWAPVDDGPDLSTPAKVAEYFGFGTWAAYGTGQVLVGVDSGQTEFSTPGKTGGEKTHQLTTAELAKHSHRMYWSNEGGTGTGNGVLVRDAPTGGPWPYSYYTETDGGNQPHNNLQPYITVYRWQRVA